MTPRGTLAADVSCRLCEVDFGGIEAVLTGYQIWRLLDDSRAASDYMRLARLGMHAALCAIKVNRPADLSWPDDRLRGYLSTIKEEFPKAYDTSKRCIHGNNYGMTAFGMVEMFPEFFPTIRDAQEIQTLYHTLCPRLPDLQLAVRRRAREVGYLGGVADPAAPTIWDHPFGYKHWFWDVLSYQPTDEVTARRWLRNPTTHDRIVQLHGSWFKVVWGGDSRRVIAYYPQSIAAGVLKHVELRLFHPTSPDYIGDAYFGRTPLLHPIHDSLLLHVPNRIYDRVVAIVVRVMQDELPMLPIPASWNRGNYLRIGVEAKGGRTWDKADMKKLHIHGIDLTPTPDDVPVIPRDEADQDIWDALQRAVA